MSYSHYLDSKKEQVQAYSKLDHPVRQKKKKVSENVTITRISGAGAEIHSIYKLLDKEMCLADMYVPIFFDENTHLQTPFETHSATFSFFFFFFFFLKSCSFQLLSICTSTVQGEAF